MNLTTFRAPSVAGATVGKLYIDGAYACHTLEDEIREVPDEPVDAWKVAGVTAIPAGRYRVTLETSPHFGADALTINDVPGFKNIRMHAGNKTEDTEGCLLLGLQATDATLIGGTSRPAVEMVRSEVRAAIGRGEEVWIDINNPVGLA